MTRNVALGLVLGTLLISCGDKDPDDTAAGGASSGDGADADGDGFDSESDCDDADPSVNPDATETWYDGVDSDCDGGSDFDADADGHDSDAHGGDDCDDTDPAVSPSATEVWYDGVDGDCDGASDFDADGDGETSAVCLSYNETEPLANMSMGGPALTVSYSFTPTTDLIVTGAELWTGRDTGSVDIGIWSHDTSTGQPDAELSVGTFSMVRAEGWQGATLGSSVALTAGTQYWIVWEPINGAISPGTSSGTQQTYFGSWDFGGSWFGPYTRAHRLRLSCPD